METLIVEQTAKLVAADGEGQKTIVNASGGTLYYKSTPDVTSASNDGSLTAGQSVDVEHATWLISTTQVRVLVIAASSNSSSSEPEDWHVIGDPGEPDFTTGKENENGTGADVPAWRTGDTKEVSPAAFYKDPFGIVHLRGMATFLGAFNPAAPPVGEKHAYVANIFTLPAGYRPPVLTRLLLPYEKAYTHASGSGNSSLFALTTDGVIGSWETLMQDPTDPILQWLEEELIGYAFSFDGISFRAAP